MHRCSHLVDQDKRSDASEGFLQLWLQQHQIVSTNRCYFAEIRPLLFGFGVLFIVRNQLHAHFVPGNEVLLHEVNEAVRVSIRLEVEVKSSLFLLDADGLVVCIVSQD